MKNLIKTLNRASKGDLIHNETTTEVILGKKYSTPVYSLSSDSHILKIWNTSNSADIYNWTTLKKVIIDCLLDDEITAHDLCDDSWNSWAFEVTEL